MRANRPLADVPDWDAHLEPAGNNLLRAMHEEVGRRLRREYHDLRRPGRQPPPLAEIPTTDAIELAAAAADRCSAHRDPPALGT